MNVCICYAISKELQCPFTRLKGLRHNANSGGKNTEPPRRFATDLRILTSIADIDFRVGSGRRGLYHSRSRYLHRLQSATSVLRLACQDEALGQRDKSIIIGRRRRLLRPLAVAVMPVLRHQFRARAIARKDTFGRTGRRAGQDCQRTIRFFESPTAACPLQSSAAPHFERQLRAGFPPDVSSRLPCQGRGEAKTSVAIGGVLTNSGTTRTLELSEAQSRHIFADPGLRRAGWNPDDHTQVVHEAPVNGRAS
jgi:hypothetical protein